MKCCMFAWLKNVLYTSSLTSRKPLDMLLWLCVLIFYHTMEMSLKPALFISTSHSPIPYSQIPLWKEAIVCCFIFRAINQRKSFWIFSGNLAPEILVMVIYFRCGCFTDSKKKKWRKDLLQRRFLSHPLQWSNFPSGLSSLYVRASLA